MKKYGFTSPDVFGGNWYNHDMKISLSIVDSGTEYCLLRATGPEIKQFGEIVLAANS